MHIVGLIVAPINAADRTLSNQTICTKQLGNCSGLMIIVAKACSDFITSDDIVQNPSAELGGRLAFRTATAGLLCIHLPTAVGDLKPRDLPEFKWVNAVLGNLKTTLAGAFHALKCSKYGEHYLAAFSYRFNRRFDLRGLVARLIVDVVRAKPNKEQGVRAHAETRF